MIGDTVEVVYDAIILAGGAARRLDGALKPQLRVGDVRLIDHALAAVSDAALVVIAGPRQPVDIVPGRELTWCREDPPGAGPVAAVAAAVPHTNAPIVLLLAADQPGIGPAVPRLIAAVPAGGVARLVDPDGRPNHLAAAWDRAALVTALERVDTPVGAAMRNLAAGAAGAQVVAVADEAGWGLDCDTPDDLDRARLRHEQRSGGPQASATDR